MDEGFYGHDVAAEYKVLDNEANEQFENNGVNVSEDEMIDDGRWYGGGNYESGDGNMLDSDEDGVPMTMVLGKWPQDRASG